MTTMAGQNLHTTAKARILKNGNRHLAIVQISGRLLQTLKLNQSKLNRAFIKPLSTKRTLSALDGFPDRPFQLRSLSHPLGSIIEELPIQMTCHSTILPTVGYSFYT